MTLPDVRLLAARLAPVSGDAAAIDARMILREAADPARIDAMVARRLAGEPLDRIFGRRGFWTLDLMVTPAVLSPRPDTETVVAAALDHLRRRTSWPKHPAILDLGTGSGAILLALLSALPEATGVGVDVSAEALAVAEGNAARHGLTQRVELVVGGWDAALGRRFDLVVANPPYIPTADIAGLDREVRDHDPRPALDGGADGLDAYRAILPLLPELLADGGLAVLEFGVGQVEPIAALAATAGLSVLEVRPDLGGRPRALALSRS